MGVSVLPETKSELKVHKLRKRISWGVQLLRTTYSDAIQGYELGLVLFKIFGGDVAKGGEGQGSE